MVEGGPEVGVWAEWTRRRNEKTEKDPADDAALDPDSDHIVSSQ